MKILKIEPRTKGDRTYYMVTIEGLDAPLFVNQKPNWVEGGDYPIKVTKPTGKNFYVLSQSPRTSTKKDDIAIVVECAYKGAVELYKLIHKPDTPISVSDVATLTHKLALHLLATIQQLQGKDSDTAQT